MAAFIDVSPPTWRSFAIAVIFGVSKRKRAGVATIAADRSMAALAKRKDTSHDSRQRYGPILAFVAGGMEVGMDQMNLV